MFINPFPSWGPLAGTHNVGDLSFYHPFGDIWSAFYDFYVSKTLKHSMS